MLPASSQQQQPAQPVYVLRGHSAQIHAVVFTRDNERIITADADGWVVVWNVGTRRPVAVWKAHEGTVMNVVGWDGKIITWVCLPVIIDIEHPRFHYPTRDRKVTRSNGINISIIMLKPDTEEITKSSFGS